MADFIINEEIPDFLETNVQEEDVDIDHVARAVARRTKQGGCECKICRQKNF
jgi:hypothetical protein